MLSNRINRLGSHLLSQRKLLFSLECTAEVNCVLSYALLSCMVFETVTTGIKAKYPTSSKKPAKDWDKLEAEVKKEVGFKLARTCLESPG